MAILTQYILAFMNDMTVVFHTDSSIQTTTIALAIITSMLLSLLFLVINLLSESTSDQQESAVRKYDKRLDLQYRRCHSMSSIQQEKKKLRTKQLSSSDVLNRTCAAKISDSSPVCERCFLYRVDRKCQRSMCRGCCYGDYGCTYHTFEDIQESCNKLIDLSKQGLVCLPDRLGYVGSHVECLNLSHNKLYTLPEELRCLKGLTSIILSYNKLTYIPDYFGNFRHLKSLHLAHNKLTSVSESLRELQNLCELDLRHNQIQSLPTKIERLSRLQHLRLDQNQLEKLPDGMCMLQNLGVLSLSHNPLQSLPAGIGKLVMLVQLDVSHCKLTSLPDSLTYCYNLTSLDLRHNSLEMLPAAIGRLHQLTELHADNNKLRYLPASITCLHLTTLTVMNNSFVSREEEQRFLRKNSPPAVDNDLIPHILTLRESSAKSIITHQVRWGGMNIPTVLEEYLSGVRYCYSCSFPMFESYKCHLEFTSEAGWGNEDEDLPIYQQICSYKKQCQFLDIVPK